MATVEILESGSGLRKSTWDIELKNLQALMKSKSGNDGFHIIFGETQGLGAAVLNRDCSDLLPAHFLDSLPKDLNGLYGRLRRQNAFEKKIEQLWYGFKIKQVTTSAMTGEISYGWQQITSFATRFTQGDAGFVICLDFPKALQAQLQSKVMSGNLYCPWKWQVLFIETMRDLYDSSVWSLRDCVRKAEKSRPGDVHSENFQPDFVYLHDIARHVDHSNETLDIAVDTIRCVRKSSKALDGGGSTQAFLRDERPLEFADRLFALEKELKGIRRRSQSLAERLRNEINLAFSLVAQRDSRVMVSIGQDSKSDNQNMRSIAIVGLIYLPGTFMSGLFGMSFFELTQDGSGHQVWQVSERFWLYWAITVPLTLFTISVWVVSFHGEALRDRLAQLKRLEWNQGPVEVKA